MFGQAKILDILQKACQLDHEVRHIIMAGYQSDDLPLRAKDPGARGFFSKPFFMMDFLNVIEKTTGQRAVRK